MRIPARYYARVGEIWLRRGIGLDGLLEALGLSVEYLLRPDASLSLTQVDALVAEGMRLTGHTDLALDLGRVLKLSSHSMVGFGILSSPDLGYALRLAARFFRLILPMFRMRYACNGRHMELMFTPVAPMSRLCLNLHLEAIAVAVHFEVRELLQGQMPDHAIYLSIEEPAHVQRYAELRQARVHFEAALQPGLRLVFPASVAGHALALADPAALEMAESRCNELVRAVVAGRQVADWTRMVLREASHGMPTLVELAHALNLSPRTLDRHLQREGVSFRVLSRQIRFDRACELLRNSERPITRIAHELGYTDAANFTRAFRREGGISPSAYRAQAGGDHGGTTQG